MKKTEDNNFDATDGRGTATDSTTGPRDGWVEAIRSTMIGRNFGRLSYGRLRGDYDIVELRTRNNASQDEINLPWKPSNDGMKVDFSDDVEAFRFTVATVCWNECESRVAVSIVPDVYRRIMDDADRGSFVEILEEIGKSMPSLEFDRGF